MPWWPVAAQPLGHLGHLGHGFKLQAGAGGRRPLGHLGHCFLVDPNDLNAGASARDDLKALGHLGHFVMLQKLAPDETSTWRDMLYRY